MLRSYSNLTNSQGVWIILCLDLFHILHNRNVWGQTCSNITQILLTYHNCLSNNLLRSLSNIAYLPWLAQDKLARILVYGGLSDHKLRSYFKLTFAVRQSEHLLAQILFWSYFCDVILFWPYFCDVIVCAPTCLYLISILLIRTLLLLSSLSNLISYRPTC